jgi:hypothetical protein
MSPCPGLTGLEARDKAEILMPPAPPFLLLLFRFCPLRHTNEGTSLRSFSLRSSLSPSTFVRHDRHHGNTTAPQRMGTCAGRAGRGKKEKGGRKCLHFSRSRTGHTHEGTTASRRAEAAAASENTRAISDKSRLNATFFFERSRQRRDMEGRRFEQM